MSVDIDQQPNIQRSDERQFSSDLEAIIKEAEHMRLRAMQRYQSRVSIARSLGSLSVIAGAGGFGWYLIMDVDLTRAIASVVLSLILPIWLHFWSEKPVQSYLHDYKNVLMPRLAHALGGFRFYPKRGVGRKILEHTRLLPPCDNYGAEDCFAGRYKNMKVMFSEATLSLKDGTTVFHGLFVLLESAHNLLDGHTIITANRDLARSLGPSRWKNLRPFYQSNDLRAGEEARFLFFSDTPEKASAVVNETFIKELEEAAMIFGDAKLSAALFGKRYMFLMIPHPANMFEPSDMFVAVRLRSHMQRCRKEIQQILEIVDIFDTQIQEKQNA